MTRIPLRDNSGSDKPLRFVPLVEPDTHKTLPPTYPIDSSSGVKPAGTIASTKIHADEPKPASTYKIDENVFYAYVVPHEGSQSLDVIVLTHPDEGFIPCRVRARFTRESYERVFELPPADCKQDPRLELYVSGKVRLPRGGKLRRYSPPFLDREVAGWKDSPRYEPPAPRS